MYVKMAEQEQTYSVPLGDKDVRLYVLDISYFSGKLEAYLKYKGINYDRREVKWSEWVTLIAEKSGLMQVPVIHDTVSDVWLRDTTPIIELFERDEGLSETTTSVLPKCPVQCFLSRLLEDFADEWMWRPALHYRWSFKTDRDMYGQRFYNEFLKDAYGGILPEFLVKDSVKRRQLRDYVYEDGIRDTKTRAKTEQLYFDVLDILQNHFQEHPFVMGKQPTMADFGFFASMFRHFSLDPTPSYIMRQRAPAVYEWVARMWNIKHTGPGLPKVSAPDASIPSTLFPMLDIIGKQYLPYLKKNAVAFRDGQTSFELNIDDACFTLNVVPYRVWCREMLQSHYHALGPRDQEAVRNLLKQHSCFDDLLSEGTIHVNWDHNGAMPPFCKERVYSKTEKVKLYTGGTPWHSHNEEFPRVFYELFAILTILLGSVMAFIWMVLSATD